MLVNSVFNIVMCFSLLYLYVSYLYLSQCCCLFYFMCCIRFLVEVVYCMLLALPFIYFYFRTALFMVFDLLHCMSLCALKWAIRSYVLSSHFIIFFILQHYLGFGVFAWYLCMVSMLLFIFVHCIAFCLCLFPHLII